MNPRAPKRRKLSSSDDDLPVPAATSHFDREGETNGNFRGKALVGAGRGVTVDSSDDEDYEIDVVDDLDEDGYGEADDSEAKVFTQDGAQKVEASSKSAQSRNEIRTKAKQPAKSTSRISAAHMSGDLGRSNTFKLQMEDLLLQARPKYTNKDKAIVELLQSIKTSIEQIPPRSPASVVDAEGVLRRRDGIAIPFPHPRPPIDAQYKMEYAKPAHINIVGSFALNMNAKSEELSIDLMVTMPQDLFQPKDYLNHRYFYKRAYVVACIAAGLKTSNRQDWRLKFENLHGNQLLPAVLVHVTKESHPELPCRTLKIKIFPAIPDDLFPAEKLIPARNCVRPSGSGEMEDVERTLLATPFYNASVKHDMLVTSYLKLHFETRKRCEAFGDACMLGRIWLRQRGWSSQIQAGGFGHFEWATVLALLMRGGGPNDTPLLSKGYSCFQLFKAVLQYTATKDLVRAPQTIGEKGMMELQIQDGSPILFDADRGLNVMFKMTPWSWKRLQYDAKATLAMLVDARFDHFDDTFILKCCRLLMQYDVVADLPAARVQKDGYETPKALLDLYNHLVEGLSDRVKLVDMISPESVAWELSANQPSIDGGRLRLGFILDPSKSHRLIDHGPSAEDKSASINFRKFWGEKAELRQFRDGSILEVVIWGARDQSGQSVFRRVLSHVLERHLGDEIIDKVVFHGDVDAELLPRDYKGVSTASNAAFLPVLDAFRKLENDLRALEEIPLQIRHLLGSDSYFSHSSIDIPSTPGENMSRPAVVVLQFEGSARWPDDLDAIQRTKMAFLLKIAELLEESSEKIRTRVGLENEDNPLFNQSFLDVTYTVDAGHAGAGSSFRIRIHHDRELSLLETAMKATGQTHAERLEYAQAIAHHKRAFIHEPAQTQALQTLATRFPAYSGTVRLLTKWIASHHLSNHISPFLTSLIATRAFTNPFPYQAASSPQTGFYRSLLYLSKWDWRSSPLVVDFGSEMRRADVESLHTRFQAWRKIDPALNRVVVFAGSNVNTEGTTWTDNGRPARVVMGRLTALAKAAVTLIDEQGVNLRAAQLFKSSSADYDFIIHLNKRVLYPRRFVKAPKTSFKNLALQVADSGCSADTASIGFDPAQLFLQDLERVFGQAVLFFGGDSSQEDAIAGLWNPACEERSWKLALGYDAVPLEQQDRITAKLNKNGILSEIARIGGEMIKTIQVKG